MTYENIQLVTASISGDIYLAKINKDGTMNTSNRRMITDEVLISATEWFVENNRKAITHPRMEDGRKPYLFHTTNEDKANRILSILKEEDLI